MIWFDRRTMVGAALAFSVLLFVPQVSLAGTTAFSQSKYQALLKKGKPFLLGVHTDWCTTCAAQKRVLSSLRGKGKPYSNLTILEMDWDKYRGSKIGKQLRIPRRSTLVMYDGGKEVGRIIAGTSSSSIKKLIDKGLN